MKIIFIHHALRDTKNGFNQNNKLEKLGVLDAKICAKLLKQASLKGITIQSIYTSNFNRCITTAKLVNKYIKVPIIEDARLNEFKSVENETWLDLQNRVRDCLYDIVFNHSDSDTVICVTSGVNIVSFISLAFNLQPNENYPFLGISSCSPIIFNIKPENFKWFTI